MHETIKTKALEDFISRMQRGTFFYIFTWFMLSIVLKFHTIYPEFFWVMSTFVIASTTFRYYVCKQARRHIFTETQKYKNLAILAVSISALLWGIFYAFILAHPELEIALLVLTILTGIIASSATALLSIYQLAATLNQTFLLLPSILVIIYQSFFTNHFNSAHFSLGIALIVSFIYLRQVCTTSRTDYINATKNQLLAESRAQKMEYLSIRDPLTELKNRLFFDGYLEKSWHKAKVKNGIISLIMIDLDHFKTINDTHGHLIGDECLVAIANTLKSNLRKEGDQLARFGGEEFILCLQDSTPLGALLIAERLLNCVSDTQIITRSGTINLTCSIGLATVNANEVNSVDDFLARADEALYQAKEGGRNQISVYTPQETPIIGANFARR